MTWFLISKTEEGITTDWDLDNQSQIDAWVAGYNEFKNITGTTVNHFDPL
jgi:Ser/Thr protein kinase RdoA (MazF antagonist)